MTGVLLIGATALWLASSGALRAQERQPEKAQPVPAADTDDQTKPYVPPSASKSVEVGNYYFRKKKYNAALSRYQEAVETDPYNPAGYLGLGRVYEKIGLKQKALASYQKYLDELPSEKQAEEAKEAHRAIDRLERALKRTGARSQESEVRGEVRRET